MTSCRLKQSLVCGLFSIILVAHSLAEQNENQPVVVTYIANEGVLISAGEQQVLIDAIHQPYGPQYLATPPASLRRMMHAESPFTSIDLILVSHIHGDHFHAPTMANYLNQRKEVTLFAMPQVADSVANHLPDQSVIRERVKRAHYVDGLKSGLQHNGVLVKLCKIAHGGTRWSWIQNAGHIITVGGKTFLHIGDPSFGEQDFKILNLVSEEIDVAILPFWFLTSSTGRRIISEFIKPKGLIAVHVSPNDADKTRKQIAEFYPDATVFTTPLERVEF
ncbi:MBL fold metallo-hydrolase [bacterium]|nr:MBL fold metallo-hydrolase [bacterium]